MRLMDGAFGRVLRNTGYLLGGKAVGSLLHLAALAVASRSLGPDRFGVVVLVHAFAQTVGSLGAFQTWQTVIQFGTPHFTAGRRRALQHVIAFTAMLDLGSGVAAMLVGIALLAVLGSATGIPEAHLGLAMLYCLLIPTMAASTATGLLRMFDRFDLLAFQSSANAALRLAGVSIAAASDAPLAAFVAVWFISDLAADLLIWSAAWWQARRRDLTADFPFEFRAAPRENRGIWRFSLATNAATSVAALLGPALTLWVGAFLGPAAAGLFRIAFSIVEAASKPGDLMTRAFFPEAARLRAEGKLGQFWSVSLKVSVLSLLVAVAIVALLHVGGADWLIWLAFGSEYEPAEPLLKLMAFALCATLTLYFLEATLIALGRAGSVLAARTVGALVAFALLALLADQLGLEAAGVAYVAGSVTVVAVTLLLLLRQWLRHRARQHARPAPPSGDRPA